MRTRELAGQSGVNTESLRYVGGAASCTSVLRHPDPQRVQFDDGHAKWATCAGDDWRSR
jgi:hypothetical protein